MCKCLFILDCFKLVYTYIYYASLWYAYSASSKL
uniref:Uncharacterized protein n=1 Tax=Anguilla anguilla TaxID=7936 RepID=A0A0E9SGV8_ANGAN